MAKNAAPAQEKPTMPAIHCAFSKLVKTSELKPHPRNPNSHPKSQLDLLVEIIRHQGWRAPVVVSNRSGFIIAGHGRYMAAKQAGWPEVPVNYQDFASEEQEINHLLADNKLAQLAEMDLKEVNSLLQEMEGRTDLAMTGYNLEEIQGMRTIMQGGNIDWDAAFDETDHLKTKEKIARCPKCQHEFIFKPVRNPKMHIPEEQNDK